MEIFKRMILFRTISEEEKSILFFAAIYNDMRLLVTDKLDRYKCVNELIKKYPGLVYPLNEGEWLLPITKINWELKIIDAWERLASVSDIDLLMKSFILNKWLLYQGLCPFVHFAFAKWYDFKKKSDVVLLADLSTTYLYKLVPNSFTYKNNTGKFIGEGAYGKVYLSKNKENIIKYPKNLASLKFMSNLEILAYNTALRSSLIKYMTPVVSFNKKDSIIEKKYIKGISGWKLLKNGSFREKPYAINQIEEIYLAACELYLKKNINIDIHPGNFQWSDSDARWYLIDYGSMPEIGADYFPRNGFKIYFQKIWLDLHALIIKEPIRSLDIGISAFL